MTMTSGKVDSSAPVGFFDSGIGGLSILEAFRALLPHEDTIYIADSANLPYGNKPKEEIIAISSRHTRELLIHYGAKMIVIACNTATAGAIDSLRREFPDVPFIGLEPAIKPAALESKTQVVGVLATEGTFSGRLYNETKARFAAGVTIVASVADEFVTLAEDIHHGLEREDSQRTMDIVSRRIIPLLDAKCDKIVLGCTHFTRLKKAMEKICASRAQIIDSSEAVARQAKRILEARGLLNQTGKESNHIFIEHTK